MGFNKEGLALVTNILWLDQVSAADVSQVGGKNASLGEMTKHLCEAGVAVPKGFATTAEAFHRFMESNGLSHKVRSTIKTLDVDNISQLSGIGQQIRQWILEASLNTDLEKDVINAYRTLTQGEPSMAVAVRSSATAEDLPEASFAGQQETLLNVRGEQAVLQGIKQVFASLYNDRAIAYRVHQGFTHHEIALSAGIQRMVRSETAASGVMFTLDTETGFDQVICLTATFGLGEALVQGAVNPDEFYVYKRSLEEGKPAILRRNLGSKTLKMVYSSAGSIEQGIETVDVERSERQRFSITDSEVETLAKYARVIEKHYQCPMDIEWAKDGDSGQLYIVQARPETVKSQKKMTQSERYILKETGEVLAEGRSIGQKIGSGPVCMLSDLSQMEHLKQGNVLVTDMTDPDWEPVMKRASAIVTNRGGRTCHAAIIARELGIPAVVGCGNATAHLTTGESVTVSCAEGDVGFVYKGLLDFERKTRHIDAMPTLPFDIMMNVGNPDRAFDFQSLPNGGVGLARLEFIINRMIGVHPKALINYNSLPEETKAIVDRRIAGYQSPIDFYVSRLVEGISTLAASFYPKKVIVRLSDFKSNEYANLIGGRLYEPEEENPMLGFRGASRYISKSFRDCFELECRAIKYVREAMGLYNVEIMVPFVRTPGEAKQVVELLAENGLKRQEHDLKIIMMCELPANALLAEEFLEYFDGFSIGSNDLTQLTLGLDRDSGIIAHLFDERNSAVKALLSNAIQACKRQGKYVGICGQGPSDHPDFACYLMNEGIDSVSLNPDSVLPTWFYLAESNLSSEPALNSEPNLELES